MKNINSFRHLFDQSTIRILYVKHKKYLLPVGIIFTSLLLFLFVIIPQIQSLLVYRDQEGIIKEKINVLKSNISFLSLLNDSDLDSKLQTVSLALPIEKDFILIMGAISKASAKAGVNLGDFSFELGQVSDIVGSGQPISTQEAKLAVQVDLIVSGKLDQTKRFINELQNTLPLSEVVQVDADDESSSINVTFYYKPLSSLNLNEEKPLQSFSQKDVELIDQLSVLINN